MLELFSSGDERLAWPADKPRLTGQMGREYDSFVQVVIRSLGNTRFTPAMLGGCAVPQFVQQPFQFGIRR